MKKGILTLVTAGLLVSLTACSPTRSKNLVGNDRDEHGCIASAGYQWSEARKDCIRIWEAGVRFESNDQSLYVVFSPDNQYAEIFAEKGQRVLCKRIKNDDTWTARGKKGKVTKDNGVTTVEYGGKIYTPSVKK